MAKPDEAKGMRDRVVEITNRLDRDFPHWPAE
jgi:hypothetical protein